MKVNSLSSTVKCDGNKGGWIHGHHEEKLNGKSAALLQVWVLPGTRPDSLQHHSHSTLTTLTYYTAYHRKTVTKSQPLNHSNYNTQKTLKTALPIKHHDRQQRLKLSLRWGTCLQRAHKSKNTQKHAGWLATKQKPGIKWILHSN